MARTKQGLRARVSRAAGRGRKQPTNPVERAFEDVKQLVSDTTDRFFSQSGQKKAGASRTRTRSGQQRQAEAKKAGASRIRSGQKRQAAAKKAARRRGVKTT